MSQITTRSAMRKCIFFRFCLQLLILCALWCLTEGRPKTLKKCGRRDVAMGKIVGGKDVQPGDFPWVVSVHEKIRFRFRHICGGTIINEHYIVTAAHCMDSPTQPWNYEIYTGLHQMSKKFRKPAKKYKVSEVIVHENYGKDGLRYDIALLRTKEPIQFDRFTNGICLPLNDDDPTGWAITAGWGDTKRGGEGPDIMKAVKVPLVSRKDCASAYEESEDDEDDIRDSQICAGIIGRDSCQGDSGGPLFQQNKRGVFTLIGVVSFGIGCAQKTYPGVYTKVASYMDWLEENMD